MGCADYSYGFVLKGLIPALEALGTWERVEHPESSLAFRAESTRAQGRRPIHLALHPPQNMYLTPALPTVVFPFWEFPRLPDRDFRMDTRQNWTRVCRKADLIVVACRFTAEAFRSARVDRPIAVVPVPLADRCFQVADWDPNRETVLHCRHAILGEEIGSTTTEPPASKPSRTLVRVLRSGFHRHARPFLSEEALGRIGAAKRKWTRRAPSPSPLLPKTDLRLSGLVYTSVFNLGDRRKNVEDMLTAFLLGFQNDPEATLVLKLATNPAREYHDWSLLRDFHRRIGIEHACRVVVATDYLSDDEMDRLMLGSTFYVNASRAEGACIPLQEALAGGRPALAPAHTAMADYMDERVGFVVESDIEPTYWPHDPDRLSETTWRRISWSSLRDGFVASAELARREPDRYRELSRTARRRMDESASLRVATDSLRRALSLLGDDAGESFDWAA